MFQSLRNILIDLLSLSNEIDSNNHEISNEFHNKNTNNNNNNNLNGNKQSEVSFTISLKDSRALLSTEIIQLFCLIPSFYDFLPDSHGLIDILILSIGDPRIYQAILNMLYDLRKQNVNTKFTYFNLYIVKI